MEDIIAPISKELLKAELTEEKRLRMTNRSHNQIYTMDIDEYDIMDNPYKQLIVWNPEEEEILGGYRYILGTDVRFDEHGAPILATAHMFNFFREILE